MLSDTQYKRCITDAFIGEKVVIVCPSERRKRQIRHELAGRLIASDIPDWKILPGGSMMTVGYGTITIKTLTNGNGLLSGLRVTKVVLDDGWSMMADQLQCSW